MEGNCQNLKKIFLIEQQISELKWCKYAMMKS